MHRLQMSSRLRHVVQDQKLRARTGHDGIGAALVVAEFDQDILVIERLDDRTNLSSRQPFRGGVGKHRHHIENRRSLAFCR
jgi:hypothetical protein